VAYALAGNRRAALDVLAEIHRMEEPVGVAKVRAALGETEGAIESLERALHVSPTPFHAVWGVIDPIFDRFHDHPRFKELLRQMNLWQ
jgi:hypothetical protein